MFLMIPVKSCVDPPPPHKKNVEDHHEQFSEALLNKEPNHLEITLCYEQSSTCVGVKRKSFEVSPRHCSLASL